VRASEWLREAGVIVRGTDPDESFARIGFGIVSTYGRFDTQAAQDWLLFTVKLMRNAAPASLNQDVAPAFKRVTGITPIADIAGNTKGFSLQAAVGVFSPDQFEDVLNILHEVRPAEARGIAVLTLCSSYLKARPKAAKKLSQPLTPAVTN
jgi:hypothetical protein